MTDPAVIGSAIRVLFLLACFVCALSHRQLALRMLAVLWGFAFLFLPIYTAAAMRGSLIGPEVGAVAGAALLVPCGVLVRGMWRGMTWAMMVIGSFSVLMIGVLLWLMIATGDGSQGYTLDLLSWLLTLGICIVHLRDTIGAAQSILAERAAETAAVEGTL